MDDILIYNNSLYEYNRYVKIFLKYLKSAILFLDVIKYKFYITNVLYLGFIIDNHSIKIDSAKIKIILEWPQLTFLKDK